MHRLLTSDNELSLAPTIAILGMGGTGKTVLAAELCRDPDIKCAFPDGVVWIHVGQRKTEEPLGDIRAILELFGYDTKDRAPGTILQEYRKLTKEKRALVVIDDVWSVGALQELLPVHARCRFLLTTRDGVIADILAQTRHVLGILDENESRELLMKWTRLTAEELPVTAEVILQKCSGLAVAIAQIGAVLRRLTYAEWKGVVKALDEVNLDEIEEYLPAGQRSFFTILALSITSTSASIQKWYLKLAVVSAEMLLPLSILRVLWGVGEVEARRIARYLVDHSLASWRDGASPEKGIRLHDLQLDYLRAVFPDKPALSLITSATRLSLHVFNQDQTQYTSQLIGRLSSCIANQTIADFCSGISSATPFRWFRALNQVLHPPGTSLLQTLTADDGHVLAVAPHESREEVLSSSDNAKIRIWDLRRDVVKAECKISARHVLVIRVAASGRFVLACYDGKIGYGDMRDINAVQFLTGHSAAVSGISFTEDSITVISVSLDGTIRRWDLLNGSSEILVEHEAPILCCAVSSDGRKMVFGDSQGALYVFDLGRRSLDRSVDEHAGPITCVAISPDGLRAVSGSLDKTIRLWEVGTGRCLQRFIGHSGPVLDIALSHAGRRAVSASADNTVAVWALDPPERLSVLTGHSRAVNSVAVLENSDKIISGSHDTSVKVWESAGSRRSLSEKHHTGWINGVAVSADGSLAISASADHTLVVWDVHTGSPLRTLKSHTRDVRAVVAVPGKQRVLSASSDHSLKLWTLNNDEPPVSLRSHENIVNCVAVDATGELAISGSFDGTLIVWDLEKGKPVKQFASEGGKVFGVTVTADGATAVFASEDGVVRVWNLASGVVRPLRGHEGIVHSVCLSRDNHQLLSTSADKTCILWDLTSELPLRRYGHHNGPVWVGKLLDQQALTCSADRTVRVWNIKDQSEQIAFTCEGAAGCCAWIDDHNVVVGDSGGRIYFLKIEKAGPESR